MEKFRNRYCIPSARLANWDYGSPGFYFVTICTQDRVCYFGDIISDDGDVPQPEYRLQETEIGQVARENWQKIPEHFPFVILDESVIMPNHLHGILFFDKPGYEEWRKNQFGPQSQNLGSVIRGYKAGVKKYATMNNIEFAWQPRYHDHIIRSVQDLERIRQYIVNNPANWHNDQNYINR
ncbi:MAG: hypothetical protein HUU32_18445 [Calditrichaceae bacterium]|nr:hypothetical protein [Calditrichaceae bacterium]